jgi:hypothetical protein
MIRNGSRLPILWEPVEGSIQRLHIPDLATIDPLGLRHPSVGDAFIKLGG